MVLQKNVLFSGTIIDNLRWGNENATEQEVIDACKAAQAHDFVMSFPTATTLTSARAVLMFREVRSSVFVLRVLS